MGEAESRDRANHARDGPRTLCGASEGTKRERKVKEVKLERRVTNKEVRGWRIKRNILQGGKTVFSKIEQRDREVTRSPQSKEDNISA